MAVTITNQTRERVLLRFNSGATHHLAPGEVLHDVEHVEVKGNPRILGLHERRIISLQRDGEGAGDDGGREGGGPSGAPAARGHGGELGDAGPAPEAAEGTGRPDAPAGEAAEPRRRGGRQQA